MKAEETPRTRRPIKRFYTPLYVLISVLSQVAGALILGLALFPAAALMLGVWSALPAAPLFVRLVGLAISAGFSVFLTGNMLLLLIVLVRRFFRLYNHEQSGDFRSLAVVSVAAYNFLVNLAQAVFLPLVRGTIFINWFYQGMGARIGAHTVITTTRIFDCDLIEIGRDCVIGGHVAINAHTGEGRQGIMRRVHIGDRVTIGANTIVLPGAFIGDGVVIGANSVVPKDAYLEAGGIYGGVPIQKIGPI